MKKTSIKTSFEPQFEYWSLIWMFHGEKVIVRLIWHIKMLSGWSIMIHYLKNFLKKIAPLLFIILILRGLPLNRSKLAIILAQHYWWLQDLIYNYNLCSESSFVVPGVGTVHNCQNPIQCYGSLIWNIILDYIKDSKNLRLGLPKLSSLQGNIH